VNYKVECHQALTSRESKMWLFCAIAIQLLRLLANVQGLALQEEDTHEENHSSVENASALLNEKHVCLFPQNVGDEILDDEQERFRTSLPTCISVSGFSSRDFTGNGIYCQGHGSTSNVGKETSDYQQPGHYYYTLSPTLRYEMRPDKGLWSLLRVIKTKGGKWIGRPIYAGVPLRRTEIPDKEFSKEPAKISPTNIEWVGLMQKRSSKGGTAFDRSEPNLRVNDVHPPKAYMLLRWALQSHISGSIDACNASMCSRRLRDELSKNMNDKNEEGGSDSNKITSNSKDGNDDDFALQIHTMKMLAQVRIHSLSFDEIVTIPNFFKHYSSPSFTSNPQQTIHTKCSSQK